MSLQLTQPQDTAQDHVQTYIRDNHQCPSIDEWLQLRLSQQQMDMYVSLVQLRRDTQGSRFPINFDSIWPQLGYTRKDNAVASLRQVCTVDVDFELVLLNQDQSLIIQNNGGGHNRTDYYLTLEAAQVFALQARTSANAPIVRFFVHAVKVLQEFHNLSQHYEQESLIARSREQVWLNTTPKGKSCVYMGCLGVIEGVRVIKIGYTDDLPARINALRNAFPNGCVLFHVVHHPLNQELERRFFQHPEVANREFDAICRNGNSSTECRRVDNIMTKDAYVKILVRLAKGLTEHTDSHWRHEQQMLTLQIEYEAVCATKHETERDKARYEAERDKARLEVEKEKTRNETEKARNETEKARYETEKARYETEKEMAKTRQLELQLEMIRLQRLNSAILDTAGTADNAEPGDQIVNAVDEAVPDLPERTASPTADDLWIQQHIRVKEGAAINRANIWRAYNGATFQKPLYVKLNRFFGGEAKPQHALAGCTGWIGYELYGLPERPPERYR